MKRTTVMCILRVIFLLTSITSLADNAKPTTPSKDTEIDIEAHMQANCRLEKLKKITEDLARDGEERIDAILEMGTLSGTNATDYLLENISLHIPKTHFRFDLRRPLVVGAWVLSPSCPVADTLAAHT